MSKKVLEWSDECEEAFLNLKKLLLNPKLLAYPNYDSSEPLELHVDASLTGAGAVLSQCQLARTLEDLADFDFTVRWIPGNTNVIADALSRVNESDTNSSENVRSDMQVDPVGSQLTE
ncbi:unnamed protein product, partial [Rotaria magnacalcarata]